MNQPERLSPLPPGFAGDGALAPPQVSGVLLRALADVVTQAGIGPSTLFYREEWDACEPTNVRIPLPTYQALLRRAIALTGDPSLGLRCALHARQACFDLLGPLVAHVPTLRQAIHEAEQFQALVLDGAHFVLTEYLGVARVSCEFPRSDEPTDRSLAEFLTASLMRMVRGCRNAQSEFHAASFEHPRPDYHRAYAEAFDGKARFSQRFTGVEFAAHLLDRPKPFANPVLQTLVHTQAEHHLQRLSHPTTLMDRLRMYLLSQPVAHLPPVAVAARRLGMSTRTMRRRLAEVGHSYRTVTQEIQGERARTLLRNPDVSLQAVADALGFANADAFHRAFKRWTGWTAGDYRDATSRGLASTASAG